MSAHAPSSEAGTTEDDALLDNENSFLLTRFIVDGPTDNAPWLAANGYRITEEGCSNCEVGRLWYDSHELVCDRCSAVIDMEDQRSRPSQDEDPWESFQEYRRTGDYRGRKRCVGGFPSSYDWVRGDEIDGPVNAVHPDEFYKS